MSEDKTILLKVTLDTADLTSKSLEASTKLQILKDKQKELAQTTGVNTVEYAKLKAEIQQQSKVLNDTAKALVINENANKNNTGSLVEMQQKLTAGTTAYKLLTKEQRENSEAGKQLQKDNLALSQALGVSEKSIGNNTRDVGKYHLALEGLQGQLSIVKTEMGGMDRASIGFKQASDRADELDNQINDLSASFVAQGGTIVEASYKSEFYGKTLTELKADLKGAKSEMLGMDASSIGYQQASQRAGELADKITEVNENVKASSGGTGFEKLSNNLSLVQNDLMNMDFAGVSEKMKQMAVISKGMTFKETLGGLKNMVSGLISMGKAILMNPMFLLVGVLIGIVAALKMFSDYSQEQAVKAQEKHTESIRKNITALQDQQKTNSKTDALALKRAELLGKSDEDLGKLRLKQFKDQNDLKIKESEKQGQLERNLWGRLKGNSDEDSRKKFADEAREANKANKALLFDISNYGAEKELIELEISNKSVETNKTNNAKISSDNKTAYDKRLADFDTLNQLILGNEDLSNSNERARIEAKYKFLSDGAQNNADELIRLNEEKNLKLASVDILELEDAKKRLDIEFEVAKRGVKKDELIELKKNLNLKKTALDDAFAIKERQNDLDSVKSVKENDAIKLEVARKTANEVLLIDAEINLVKAKGLSNEAEMFKAFQDAKIKVLESDAKKEIELNKLVGNEAEKVNQKLALDTIKVNSETVEAKKVVKVEENEFELTAEQKKQVAIGEASLNSASQLSGALFQLKQNSITEELNAEKEKSEALQENLKAQLDAGLIDKAKFDELSAKANAELRLKERKLKEEQFKAQKTASLIQAGINIALGVTQALAGSPPPLNFILAGTTAALGALEVGAILSAPTPKFEKGGQFGGQSHANGGTKGVFSDGTQIEVEAGENFYILNKNASKSIAGLSALNVAHGGSSFYEGGKSSYATGGIVANLDNQFSNQNNLINMLKLMPSPIVVVQDINDAQGNLANVMNRASF